MKATKRDYAENITTTLLRQNSGSIQELECWSFIKHSTI